MPKSKQKKKKRNKIIKVLSFGLLSFLLLFFLFFGSIYIGLWGKVPTEDDLADIQQSEASELLDFQGRTIDKIYQLNRQSITYDDFPEHLKDALVATEDARFYEHDGVDNYSLLRVFFKTILSGDKSSGGGSTITQQLAKNIYGRTSYGLMSIPVNKLKESIVAKRFESFYSKQEILELYLNTVPFSGNTYGIESASQLFFNKSASDLNLQEAATLVGTLKANHSYNPRLFPERSQLRRDVVLSQMQKYGYISKNEADKAMSESIQLDISESNTYQRQYLVDLLKTKAGNILKDLKKPDGSAYIIEEDGLKIHTTIDLKQQLLLEEAIVDQIKYLQPLFEDEYNNNKPWENEELLMEMAKNTRDYKRWTSAKLSPSQIEDSLTVIKPVEVIKQGKSTVLQLSILDSLSYSLKQLNAASLSINPGSGEILAYVGGADYRLSQYDIIKNAKRQVGSTFKPIVYASGLQNGMEPCDYISAKEITYTNADNWNPKNASKGDEDDPYLNYSLKYALTNSINTVSVKVLEESGISNTIDLAKSMGISSALKDEPSLALGAAELSMKELAKVYSSIVNAGLVPELHVIQKITNSSGEVIFENDKKHNKTSDLSVDHNRLLLAMLENVVNEGTAKRLRSVYGFEGDIAGKTGTTQNNRDGWFAAVTPNLVNISWVGNNDQRIGFKSTRIGQGANTALPIFARMYQKMANLNEFEHITKAKFSKLTPQQKELLTCENQKRDGFFKRLFSKDKREKEFDDDKEDDEEKKGFFKRLFGNKEN
ncbi:transglycosylase domain-containing protein [Psychroflexus tropicus]|uniref:transglycosylase domain-containing protein n=1 Tax=Psychroflexus tropicus TaxID=197345 RepID=UPI00035F612F|nr:transglycosylase domain-containing protein [Psychroflexus tropicus]